MNQSSHSGKGWGRERSPLPYEKAFVVQFTADTDERLGRAGGRVEHLQTGRQARFASVVEFLACIARMLANRGTEVAPRRRPDARRRRQSGTGPDSTGPPPAP